VTNFRLRVEADRVLQLLSSQIYDSPFAMLRENVQNAYDATLMRHVGHGVPLSEMAIDVVLEGHEVSFVDRGIGMSESVLRGNYWSAGSSGKTGDLARRAGVVGTFGIGAMANFGVADRLEVETQEVGSNVRLWSGVSLRDLSLDKDCIELRSDLPAGEPGTTVRLTLKAGTTVSEKRAAKYLAPFVRFLPVPVRVNGTNISQGGFFEDLSDGTDLLRKETWTIDSFTLPLEISVNPNTSALRVACREVKLDGVPVGRLALRQDGRSIDGLRSGFRLAALPVSSPFQWGGRIDVTFLTPTAGREALTRDSIRVASRIVTCVDTAAATALADSARADQNTGFLTYVRRKDAMNLAGNVRIRVANEEEVPLSKVTTLKGAHFYLGADPATIEQFSSGAPLLLVSNRQPRRAIQQRWLAEHRIPEVPDRAHITSVFPPEELSRGELALKLRVESVLQEDYLLPRTDVRFAEISHGVTLLLDAQETENPVIYLRRGGPGIAELLQVRETSPDLFAPFTKDYVRNHVYRHVQGLVPSAARQGAEKLKALLNKRKELYRYESEEVGNLDPILVEFLEGKITMDELLSGRSTTRNVGRQRVSASQVGAIEREIPTLGTTSSPSEPDDGSAMPGILRLDTDTKMKVLVAESGVPILGGFRTFLGLTDKVSARDKDFFIAPHHTRVIWAQHRVIFVFQHASGGLSFYYDVELKEPLDVGPGGREIPTTTLITKSRVFVPVPTEIEAAFAVSSGKREFFVRYDFVTS